MRAWRGDIRSRGFDLNGAWSPLYNWHKVLAGLLDADRYCGEKTAVDVATRLGGYIESLFAELTPAQVQQVLLCEYGGLNESFAELHARTGQLRWLALSRKLFDQKVLQPLIEGRDELANLHANTQVPKLIGLHRLYELTGERDYARAAGFFWDLVTSRYSYVIGGNADREYFQAPLSISRHITEQTCESCNTYNMLKLTRQLYAAHVRHSPAVLLAIRGFLVLRRHRDGEPRTARRLDLLAKAQITVRFEPEPNVSAGPVFGVRLLTAEAATGA